MFKFSACGRSSADKKLRLGASSLSNLLEDDANEEVGDPIKN